MKLKSFVKSLLSSAIGVMLFSCANNAPAPVFDITLAEKVIFGLKNAKKDKATFPVKNASPQTGSKVEQYESELAISSIQPPPSAARNIEYSSYTPKRASPNITHVVKRGETLYSIAWQYSLDHKLLAEANGLTSGAIYPGQVLNVDSQFLAESSRKGFKAQGATEQAVFDKSSLVAALNKEILNSPSKNAKRNSQNQGSSSISASNLNKLSKLPNSKVRSWIWPVNGKVVKHFSNRSANSKGVDISAQKGAVVRASAQGKVVYSGSGLRGYGQLVIIKHNDLFLSAYAHNDKVHVNENEFVKAGQKIADLGSSGNKNQKLHFEIRYKGKPVDPLNYLPKAD